MTNQPFSGYNDKINYDSSGKNIQGQRILSKTKVSSKSARTPLLSYDSDGIEDGSAINNSIGGAVAHQEDQSLQDQSLQDQSLPDPSLQSTLDLNSSAYILVRNTSESRINTFSTPHHGEAHKKVSIAEGDGQSKLGDVLYNMLNAIVGAGVVGLPYVFQQSGLLGGTLLIIFFALVSNYSLKLLIIGAKLTKTKNYEDLCQLCYGSIGYFSVSFSMFIFDLGAMLSYLIILGDAMQHVLSIWGYGSLFYRRLILLVVNVVIILPPCLFRDISSIEKLSGFSVFVKMIILVVIIFKFIWIRLLGYGPQIPMDYSLVIFKGLPPALGIVAFASVCHDSAFLVYNTLRDHSLKRWKKLTCLALSSSSSICLVFSYAAFFTFSSEVDDNILNNFSSHDVVMIVTRIMYSISMALSYPTAFYVVRHVCYAVFHRGPQYTSIQKAPLWKHLLFTIPIWLIVLILSLLISSLGIVMSVTGSLAAVSLAFILPTLCYLKLCKYKIAFWNEKPDLKYKAFTTTWPPFLILVLGVFLAVFCCAYSLLQYYHVI